MRIHETYSMMPVRFDWHSCSTFAAVQKLNDMIRIPVPFVVTLGARQEWRGLKRIECLLGALTAEAASSQSSKPADSGFQTSFKWKLSIFGTLFKLFGESIPVINGFFQGHELQRTMTSSSPILGPQSPLFPRRPGSDRRIGCLHQEEPHH